MGFKIFLPKSNWIPKKHYMQTIDEKMQKAINIFQFCRNLNHLKASSSICALHLPKMLVHTKYPLKNL